MVCEEFAWKRRAIQGHQARDDVPSGCGHCNGLGTVMASPVTVMNPEFGHKFLRIATSGLSGAHSDHQLTRLNQLGGRFESFTDSVSVRESSRPRQARARECGLEEDLGVASSDADPATTQFVVHSACERGPDCSHSPRVIRGSS